MEHRRPFLMVALHSFQPRHKLGPEPHIDGMAPIFPFCHSRIMGKSLAESKIISDKSLAIPPNLAYRACIG